jgi:hypothetical protein
MFETTVSRKGCVQPRRLHKNAECVEWIVNLMCYSMVLCGCALEDQLELIVRNQFGINFVSSLGCFVANAIQAWLCIIHNRAVYMTITLFYLSFSLVYAHFVFKSTR